MIAALLLLTAAVPQTTPTRLPPANPIAYADDDAAAVLGPLQALLVAQDAGNAAGIAAATRPEGMLTVSTVRDNAAELRQFTFAELARDARPGASRVQRRLLDTAIEVDGDIAMVWAPYATGVDGRAQTCGTLHADLVRGDGRWRVLHLTLTSRSGGCAA